LIFFFQKNLVIHPNCKQKKLRVQSGVGLDKMGQAS